MKVEPGPGIAHTYDEVKIPQTWTRVAAMMPMRNTIRVRWLLSLVCTSIVLGCGTPRRRSPVEEPPRIERIEAPHPILVGSVVRVSGISLDRVGREPVLEVLHGPTQITLPAVPHDDRWAFSFVVSEELVFALGEEVADVDLVLSGNSVRTEAYRTSWQLASELPLRVDGAPGGDVSRNETWVLRGDGFISPTEGETTAHFSGTFTRDVDGVVTVVDARTAVTQLERSARDRGVMVLTTDLGGLWPGTFDGTLEIDSTLRNGFARSSGEIPVQLRFGEPQLFSVEPTMASVGQLLRVRGSGFLGGRDRPTEATLIRIDGTFTPRDGTAFAFGPVELVPRFESGSEVRLVLETEVSEGRLVARLFGQARGVFEGRAAPIVISGSDEVTGAAVPFRFVLGPVTQVVYLRFLPGFYDSLGRFGLASAASGPIEEAIARRIEGIYEHYRLDVRLEEPDDFDQTAYSVVEIGGPDPNGKGLFGYDSTPGKDVGNLRLFDRIGGANAEIQSDGSRGYGGVFVDSLLWWSSHPELPGTRPPNSPMPDPLFDELFEPVRFEPATFDEVRGVGEPERVARVQRAIEALASIIGETIAHELGHSLGMAQPYGSPTSFHNDFDGDGCLMDYGGNRPLGERSEQPGYARTVFCHDEPQYMREILGM